MILAPYFVFGYGIVILIGGVIGYLVAGSFISLIMGAIFGFVLLGSGRYMLKNNIKAYYCAYWTSIVLVLLFLYRFLVTFKIMPAAMIMVLGVVTFNQIFRDLRKLNRRT